MEKYINYEMCKKCGGVCCKQIGLLVEPTQIGGPCEKRENNLCYDN